MNLDRLGKSWAIRIGLAAVALAGWALAFWLWEVGKWLRPMLIN